MFKELTNNRIQKIILGLMCIEDKEFYNDWSKKLDVNWFDNDVQPIFRAIHTLRTEGEIVDLINLKKSGLPDCALNMVFKMVTECPVNANIDWYIDKLKEDN
jgi:replicative DNA helicase